MSEPTEAERDAQAIQQRQAACDKHVKDRKPFDCFIGNVCAFCGMTRAAYERTL